MISVRTIKKKYSLLYLIQLKVYFKVLKLQYLLSKIYVDFSGQTGAGKTYTIVGNCP